MFRNLYQKSLYDAEKIAIAALQESVLAAGGSGPIVFELDGAATSPTNFYVAGTNGEDRILVKGSSPAFIYLPKFGEVVNGTTVTFDTWKTKEFTITIQRGGYGAIVVPGGGSYGFSYGYGDLMATYPTLMAPDGATSGYQLPAYSFFKFSQVGNDTTATRWVAGQMPLINDRLSLGYNDFHGGAIDLAATVMLLNQSEYSALMLAQQYRSKVVPIETTHISGYVHLSTDTGSELPIFAASIPGSPYAITASVASNIVTVQVGSGTRLLSLNIETLITPVAGEIVIAGIPMCGNYLPTLSITRPVAGGMERVMGNPFTRSDLDGSLHITGLAAESYTISLQW